MSIKRVVLAPVVAMIWLSLTGNVGAQYQPIPNYTGIGAGQKFRNDINNHLSGVTPAAPRIVTLPFASLPSEQDGQLYWCKDCMQANPCAGGGTGAMAAGQRGIWSCTAGGSINGVYNVIEFGANSLGTGDASAGAQAAINAACAATLSPQNAGLSSVPTVYFPPGVYWFSKPVINTCGKPILIEGAGMGATGITAKISGVGAMTGPLFVTMASNYVSSLGTIFGTSLATGAGNSLVWSGSAQGTERFYFDIDDAIINDEGGSLTNPAPLNGLGQFDIRAFAKLPSNAPTNATYIWASSNGAEDGQTGCGQANSITSCAGAYGIGAINGGGHWNAIAYLKVAGTTYELTGNQNNFLPASVHEEEISYDGSNIRLMVDGILVAVQATTGTVTQRPDENMLLGGINQLTESNTIASTNPWLGSLDSVQLSTVARSTCGGSTTVGAACYTAATAKFSGDSNTLFLTNFDQTLNSGALIAADYTSGTGNNPAWMVLRNYLLDIGTEQDFRDLGMSSQTFGIFDAIGTQSTFVNINYFGTQAGIYLLGEAFISHIENYYGAVAGFGTAPFIEVQGSGLTDLENVHLTCGFWCIIGQDYLTINHPFLQVSSTTIHDVVLQGGATVTDLEEDTENCGSSIGALVVGSNETRFVGGTLTSCSNQPLMVVSPVGLRSLLLDGTTGSVSGNPAEYIDIEPSWSNGSGLQQPVKWIAPSINGQPVGQATATVPLSNLPNQVVAESGITKVLNVRDFGAKCDNTADDTAAIQAAFNAAASNAQPVYFPPGTCYVAGTITYKGQSFYGAGAQLSMIRGAPGKDVFQTPDPANADNGIGQNTYVHDIQIEVDSTSDISASNTNRLIGRHFYDGSVSSGSAVLTSTQAEYTAGDVGHSIQINGAGASGGNLVTTIASLVNPGNNGTTTQANLATTASTSVSSATGYIALDGNGVTTTVGNCAFAFQDSDGNPSNWRNAGNHGLLHATFARVFVNSYGANEANHTCGFFMQMEPYATTFDDTTVNQMFYGYIEALPALNQTSREFAPDDNVFRNLAITALVPFDAYDGQSDTANNLQLYSGNTGGLGFYLLSAKTLNRNAPADWTVNSLFVEPSSSTSAIIDWITGSQHTFIAPNFSSGGTNVVEWDGAQGRVLNGVIPNDGTHQALKVSGNENYLLVQASNPANFVSDTGTGNRILANGFLSVPFNSSRPIALNSTRMPPAGGVSGDFAQTGSAFASYLNNPDLFITPADIQWMGMSGQPVIAQDSTVKPDGQYVVLPQADLTAFFKNINGQTWQAGSNVPLGKVRVYIMEKASVNCTEGIFFADSSDAFNYGSTTENLTTNWQIFSFDADLSPAMAHSAGALRMDFNYTNPNTATVYVAWIAIRPWGDRLAAGGINDSGLISTTLLATPSAAAVTVNGATGSTSYTYFCVGHDAAGGVTPVSSGTTIANGNATLSTSNFNAVSCGPEAGVVSWDILKTNTSTSLVTGATGNGGATVNDIGQSTGAYTAPSRNSTGDVVLAAGAVARLSCSTVANLPTSPAPGSLACATDWNGTAGTCTGGGSNYALALFNGAAWLCDY